MQGLWLLSASYFKQCSIARASFVFDQEKHQAFVERTSGPSGERQLMVTEGVAHIPVIGTLTKQPDFFFDMMMGGSAVYGDIVRQLAAAEGDADVKSIVLEIDSPGGEVSGFFETAAAIAATTKPIEAHVTDQALSAAYGLAAATDRIVINNPMAGVGSIGVVTSRFIDDNRLDITSTEAPNKRPDASTDEGIAVIRAELDAMHSEFVGIISQGRGKTEAEINADFGRGSNILARDALQLGMIDVINMATSGVSDNQASAANIQSEFSTMNLTEFKAAHPAVFAECLAAGVASGTADERERAAAHIEMGKATGAMDLAVGYIADGTAFSGPLVQSKYMAAGLAAGSLAGRVDDNPDTGAPAAGKTASGADVPDSDEHTMAIFGEVRSNLGLSADRSGVTL